MQLTTIENLTMTSLEIAELVEKQHAHVMRDIRKIADDLGESNFGLATYTDKQGKQRDMYVLDKDMTLTLISGYNVELRHKIVTRWRELEENAQRSLSPAELILQQAQQLVSIERQQREHESRIAALEKQQSANDGMAGYMTVTGFCNKHDITLSLKEAQAVGKACTAKCKDFGITVGRVPDERYGAVKTYPIEVLSEVLFG